MKISTNFQDIVDEPKINAELLVIENNTEKNYKIGIEIRGSSSKMFPKKGKVFIRRLILILIVLNFKSKFFARAID